MGPGAQRALASRVFAAHRRNYLICQKRYFAAYEVTKKALTPANASSSDLNIGRVILAGGMAGIAMWSIAIPPDVSFTQLTLLIFNILAESRALGFEIEVAVRAHRHIFWYHGLRPENYRYRRCESAMEGVRTSHGTSGSLRVLLMSFVFANLVVLGIPCKCGDIRKSLLSLFPYRLVAKCMQLGVEASRKLMDGLF